MNPCSNHPPNFPPWHGKSSPVIDPRESDHLEVEKARHYLPFAVMFVISGFIWAGLFVIIKWCYDL